jgi:hypothetical protein
VHFMPRQALRAGTADGPAAGRSRVSRSSRRSTLGATGRITSSLTRGMKCFCNRAPRSQTKDPECWPFVRDGHRRNPGCREGSPSSAVRQYRRQTRDRGLVPDRLRDRRRRPRRALHRRHGAPDAPFRLAATCPARHPTIPPSGIGFSSATCARTDGSGACGHPPSAPSNGMCLGAGLQSGTHSGLVLRWPRRQDRRNSGSGLRRPLPNSPARTAPLTAQAAWLRAGSGGPRGGPRR